jgi:hypothetical protein
VHYVLHGLHFHSREIVFISKLKIAVMKDRVRGHVARMVENINL